MTHPLSEKLRRGFGLFSSVIKSGEQWTSVCEEVYVDCLNALHELDRLTTPSADAAAEANIVAKKIAKDLSAQGRKLGEPLGHELYFRVLEAGAPMIAQAIEAARREEQERS